MSLLFSFFTHTSTVPRDKLVELAAQLVMYVQPSQTYSPDKSTGISKADSQDKEFYYERCFCGSKVIEDLH